MSDTPEFDVYEPDVPRCTSTITLHGEERYDVATLQCTRRLGHTNEHVVESRRDGRGPHDMDVDLFKLEWFRKSGY